MLIVAVKLQHFSGTPESLIVLYLTNISLSTPAGRVNPANSNLTYGQLVLITAEKIMGIAGRFAAKGNQTIENLAHLKADQIVGEWRDSTYGR